MKTNNKSSIQKLKKEVSPGCFVEIETCSENGLITVNPRDAEKVLSKKSSDKNLSSEDVILLLLGADPEVPIKETLFMKEAFLLEKEVANEVGLNINSLNFYPHHFGPFSRDLDENIEKLNGDLINIEYSNNKKSIKLTEKGKRTASKLLNKLPDEKVDKLKYKRLGWDQYGNRGILLRVYRDYPVYASKSKIKDDLLGDD
ncbi:MAG: hypothetical protein ABFC34_07790 [Methanobacterium sp.]